VGLEEMFLDPEDSGVGYPLLFPASVPDHWRGQSEYRALAIDPGGTTGWNLTVIDKRALQQAHIKILESVEFWSAGELTGPEGKQANAIAALAIHWQVNVIIIEDFILRTMAGGRDLLAPVRVSERVEQALWGHSIITIKQQPALAMSTMTDARMRASGLWLSGMPHGNDSTRHAWTWLRRKKALLSNGKG
jgi:hypothetical protein